MRALLIILPEERREGFVETLRQLEELEREGRERAAKEHMRELGLIP